MEQIKVKNLKKSFKNNCVLKDINFSVKKGEIISIIGPSGSGKSTLLRCLIDLEKTNFGEIYISNQQLCKNGVYKSPKEISTICEKQGMIFQNFNLFPHLTVRENLALSPRIVKKIPKNEIDKNISEILNKVGLIDKINEMPSKLSGGQKQRVAIARGLMLSPEILLFDEPTSSLDPELTKEVLMVIKNLSKDNITMIIVTHEIGFAKEISDKILFMDDGIVIDFDTPENIIDNQKNERIKSFLSTVF